MSDLNSVAEIMGIPADLVSRSADARAAAAGTTTDEVLSAWGGGGAVATAAPTPMPEPTEDAETDVETPTQQESEAPDEPVATQPSPPPMPVDVGAGNVAGTDEPPVLVGAHDNPWSIVAGVIGLFLAVVLLGLIGPSIPVEEAGARTSAIALTDDGLAGRSLYGNLGCAGCHTQMVRPIIADVGLGPVTLSDTNQVLGARRFGPDLSDIGNRMSGAQMESTIRGLAGHPSANLSDESMDQLVTYLLESAPPGGGS